MKNNQNIDEYLADNIAERTGAKYFPFGNFGPSNRFVYRDLYELKYKSYFLGVFS